MGPAQLFPVACGSVPSNIYCPLQNPENTSISCSGNISHVCRMRIPCGGGPRQQERVGKRALNVFHRHRLQQNRKPDALQGQLGHGGSEGSAGILGGSESRRVLSGCAPPDPEPAPVTFVWCRALLFTGSCSLSLSLSVFSTSGFLSSVT